MGVTNAGNMKISIPQGCLKFDGVDDWVYVPNIYSDLSATDPKGTISCWINHTCTQTSYRGIIRFNLSRPLIYLDSNSLKVYYGGSTGFPTSDSYTNSYNVIGFDAWHHIAFCWDSGNSTYELYCDGALLESGDSVNLPLFATTTIDIGQYSDSNYISGLMSDVKIYNTDMTSTQVTKLYNGVEPDSSSLIVHLKMNDREGVVADDNTSNNYDGVISGALWTDRDIRCWGTRFQEGNWDVVLETFVDACDRNYLFDNVIPGAQAELYNILGTPTYKDTTYSSSNTIIISPIHGYGISSLRQKRTIAVKSISDTFINKDLFGIKIESVRL